MQSGGFFNNSQLITSVCHTKLVEEILWNEMNNRHSRIYVDVDLQEFAARNVTAIRTPGIVEWDFLESRIVIYSCGSYNINISILLMIYRELPNDFELFR